MLSKTIETLKYLLLEYRFYFCSIALLLALLIYSYNKTLDLEKELIRIEKELQMNQTTFERRQKAYDEKAKQQREKLERMIKEIKSEK
ncbi:hypothetical protein [Flavobacterium gawalongense]|uniref:Uncharacterized protein n=1 Tax=Flavobacterium gawalongense TaxID=2594432 RepID=A0ABY3CPY3_9FLAO|nr:hypothetical protein [Flavobacterium gawalongense]TRW99031.1 hypothetical protein FNW33_15260 [Flavobacterium gawalongense]TRX09904.1 hypothetical protein FNW12_01965 [Flavobacterium gawalongense]